MEYEDRITIETPEGVDLELTLAGLVSRFIAALIDFLIQLTIAIAAGFVLIGVEGTAGVEIESGLGAAILVIVLFLVTFGYDILFEVFASGRTPGKRLTGLRVVRVGGQPLGFVTSSIRNVLRLVDILPSFYVVGGVSILASSRNQRVGDIVAGTLVVRERRGGRRRAASSPGPPALGASQLAWDVSAITSEELATVRRFLDRRFELTPGARGELARTLAERLRPKVAGAEDATDSERFLEQLRAAKSARV